MQVTQPTHSSACKEADRARARKAHGPFYKYRLKKELLNVLAEGFSRWREQNSAGGSPDKTVINAKLQTFMTSGKATQMQKESKPPGLALGRRTGLRFSAVLTELSAEHQFGLWFNSQTPKCGSNFPHVCKRFPVYLPNVGPNICSPKTHLLYEPMCCEKHSV